MTEIPQEKMEEMVAEAVDVFLIGICERAQLDRFYLFSLILDMMESEGFLMPENIDGRTLH